MYMYIVYCEMKTNKLELELEPTCQLKLFKFRRANGSIGDQYGIYEYSIIYLDRIPNIWGTFYLNYTGWVKKEQ